MRRRHRRTQASAESTFQGINITPFTDVLLVLLIIFLIAGSSLTPTATRLEGLSPAAEGGAADSSDSAAAVWMSSDGDVRVRYEGKSLSLDGLKALAPPPEVIVQAHPLAKSGRVVALYDELLEAGLSEVSLGSALEFEE